MTRIELKIDEDYYLDEFGRYVFTEQYHIKRGYCCSPMKEPGCKHCPYRPKKTEDSKVSEN